MKIALCPQGWVKIQRFVLFGNGSGVDLIGRHLQHNVVFISLKYLTLFVYIRASRLYEIPWYVRKYCTLKINSAKILFSKKMLCKDINSFNFHTTSRYM